MVANSFGNKSCMQPIKGSAACPNKGPDFFFLGLRWGGGGIFSFFFSGVLPCH
jgi:hypothetical protein